MKTVKLLSTLLVISSISLSYSIAADTNEIASASTTSTKATSQPLATQDADSEALVKVPTKAERALYFETYGYNVSVQSGLTMLDASDEEFKSFQKGLETAVKGESAPADVDAIGPAMEQFFESRIKTKQESIAMANKTKEDTFFQELDKNKSIQKSKSGLYYEIFDAGKGKTPTSTDTVKVHYKGTLTDGKEFDSSYKRGEPAEFPLQAVIPAFREGMALISEGGKAKLYVPAELGYGDAAIPGIPAGSTLIFEIELIKVNPDEVVTEASSATSKNS